MCAFATELLQGSRPGDALNEEAAEAIRRGGIRMTHGEAAASARRLAAALGGGP